MGGCEASTESPALTFCSGKAERPSILLDRSLHQEFSMRHLFRVKASGKVEVPGLVILALVTLLAVLGFLYKIAK